MMRMLRCLDCGGRIEVLELSAVPGYPDLGPDGRLACTDCAETYPLIAGTPRMLDRALRSRLHAEYPRSVGVLHGADELPGALDGQAAVKQRTAEGFAYEWRHFGQARAEWRKNFLDYMRPH